MIDFYFIRHGETIGNVAKRNQPDHTPLTGRGQAQAAAAGTEVAALCPTHFYTSPHVRTVETSRVMSMSLDLIPERHELFVELKRPGHTDGYKHFGLTTLLYLFRWYVKDAEVLDERGESYHALRERLSAARAFLATLPDGARVVVVSHSIFISLFIAHMVHPGRLSLIAAARCLRRILTIKNGSITHVVYDPTMDTWELQR